ncbi:MAG: NAD(P)H-dependent oxidoreductase [Winogradskyella sp.]|uniref:FMN-dependent NADH-azoreductase n=1 Tax=Winogradskyella sp. TaxID=1883156 RepID=UPI0025D40109|nr:NAD(P)H-dependent oxidoreductase [Winogradskyella sp.]NRB59026.1 NAD(P)H-dependent oxidoreductase [Winogradskyella sp.]
MKILNINASSNRQSSISSTYANKLINRIKEVEVDTTVVNRHTTYSDLPFLNEEMLASLFVKGERTDEQKKVLEISQQLVEELLEADTIVIASPIYNFSVPASLKAYFDLVARAGLTFQYTENGPVGLLKNKKAYVVVSSGGTEIDSEIDFAGRYIQHFLGFIGISDVEMIKLDQLMFDAETKQETAQKQISQITKQLQTI